MIASEAGVQDGAQDGAQGSASAPHVLIVDDEPGDIELMRIAFEMCQIPVCIVAAADGAQAMELLRQSISSRQEPELVVLDLNMPRMDGWAVIAALRAIGLTERIPVIVLSTSRHREDMERCLKAGASAFFSKPDDLGQLLTLTRTLSTYFRNP